MLNGTWHKIANIKSANFFPQANPPNITPANKSSCTVLYISFIFISFVLGFLKRSFGEIISTECPSLSNLYNSPLYHQVLECVVGVVDGCGLFYVANSKTSIEEREQPQAEERGGEGGEGEGGKKKEEVDSPTKVTASETDEQVMTIETIVMSVYIMYMY